MSNSSPINRDMTTPAWIKDKPEIEGELEISRREHEVLIAGDPKGLQTLGNLLIWLANFNQEAVPGMPDGERYHVPLHPYHSTEIPGCLTSFSDETELCRLDAKGSGRFPEKYNAIKTPSKRHQDLRELTLKDVEVPDCVELVYAVCACGERSCGWGGWIMDSLFKSTEMSCNTDGKTLQGKIGGTCPACGLPLFRTDTHVCFKKAADFSN